jgi:hypothetical protein
MLNRSVLAAFCVAVCVFAQPSPAEACGCGGGASLSLHVTSATAVFVGTVETVTGGMPQPIVATFSVAKAYRGALGQPAVVSGDGTNCDIAFAKGVTYLVYAKEHAGMLLTHKCTRTRSLSGAAEDVRYLDNLTAGRPQVLVYGDVFRGIIQPDGSAARQALFEPLEVVAVSARGRRSVITDQWGPYQIVLAPGDYELWVERRGQRVTAPEKLLLRAGEERRLSFTAQYP